MSDEGITLRIGTWNTNWAKPGTERGRCVAKRLAAPGCDLLCVTEGYAGILPASGHLIDAGSDWGYAAAEGRRKVLLWSKRPWFDVDPVGSDALPGGRFVAATTETVLGLLSVVGVCIPWRDAHVRTGRKDRRDGRTTRLGSPGSRPCIGGKHGKGPLCSATSISGFHNGGNPWACTGQCGASSRGSASPQPGNSRERRKGRSIISPIPRTWRLWVTFESGPSAAPAQSLRP